MNTLETRGRPGALHGVYVVRGLSVLSVVVVFLYYFGCIVCLAPQVERDIDTTKALDTV